MSTIYLRPSTLEAYRNAVSEIWGSEAELDAAIRRGQHGGPESWQMAAGTEWHRLLASEKAEVERYGRDHSVESEHKFSREDVLAARKVVGPGLWEVSGRKVFDLPGGHKAVLRGTCDHLNGLEITDNKTKFGAADPADYECSLQWRCYLSIFGGASFRYLLWNMKGPDKEGFFELKEVVQTRMYPYPGMDHRLKMWIHDFRQWAEARGLLPFLEKTPGW